MSLYRQPGGASRLSSAASGAPTRDITYGGGAAETPGYLNDTRVSGAGAPVGGGVVYGNASQYLPQGAPVTTMGSPARPSSAVYSTYAGRPSYLGSPDRGAPIMSRPVDYGRPSYLGGGRMSVGGFDDAPYHSSPYSSYSHALRRRYSSSRRRSLSPDFGDDLNFSSSRSRPLRRSMSRGSRSSSLYDRDVSYGRDESAWRQAKDRQREVEHHIRRKEEDELEILRKRHEERRREAAARRLYEREIRKAEERDERISAEVDTRQRRADRVYERLLREGEAIARETYEKELRKVEQIEREHERDRREHLRAVDRDVHDIASGRLRERRDDDDSTDDSRGRSRGGSRYGDDDSDRRGSQKQARGKSKDRKGRGGKKKADKSGGKKKRAKSKSGKSNKGRSKSKTRK